MLFQVFRELNCANPWWLYHVKMLANNVIGNLWRTFHSKELKQKEEQFQNQSRLIIMVIKKDKL